MEFLSAVMGIGLSAACGFRIFVPFFIMSVALMNGYIKPAAANDDETASMIPAHVIRRRLKI